MMPRVKDAPSLARRHDRAALGGLQVQKLRGLLNAILPANPFYATKFAGLAPQIEGLKAISDLASLPFTTRVEIMEDQLRHPPYGTNLTFELSRYVRLHQTSGTTTGRPLRWLDTAESWDWVLSCWRLIYEEAGVGREDRLFFPFSFGPFLGFWAGFEAAARNGFMALPGGGMSSEARLRFLEDNRATVVCCTPTYAIHLADVAEQNGVDLASSSVRMLIVAGEPGGSVPAVRSRIEGGWGARCIDHSGMTEVGSLGYECAEEPGFVNLIETECIPEVIDVETGTPILEEVAEGELVLTTLGRTGSPLIRYRTGDWVRLHRTPSPLGRTFARMEGGIRGRIDDMVIIRGNNLYPAALDGVIRQFAEVVEYRAEVTRRPDGASLKIEVEPSPLSREATLDLRSRIERSVRNTFLFTPDVICVGPGTLPRFEMKARRFHILDEPAATA